MSAEFKDYRYSAGTVGLTAMSFFSQVVGNRSLLGEWIAVPVVFFSAGAVGMYVSGLVAEEKWWALTLATLAAVVSIGLFLSRAFTLL